MLASLSPTETSHQDRKFWLGTPTGTSILRANRAPSSVSRLNYPAMPDSPVIDPQAIENLRALSPDEDGAFLRELIEIYLQDTPERLNELEAALAAQDAPTLARAAHTIKGSSSNFGATKFTRLAQEIELCGKSANLVAVAAVLPDFKAEYARVKQALSQITGGL
jgi:histidine phosphotransfer protein HptB